MTNRTRSRRNAQSKEQLDWEMRQSRRDLFIQQFEKEGQERMYELETKVENNLATVDKVFKVELMKMPPSLKNARIGDLISEEQISASEVSIALQNEALEMHQPLRRGPSRRGKSTDIPLAQSNPAQKSKGGKGTRKTKTIVGWNSVGNTGGSSMAAKRTKSCLTKATDQTPTTGTRLRSVVSTGDLNCSMAGHAAHITVTTAMGKAVSFCEETKDEINLDLLDDVALSQIQRLQSLMQYLSRRSRCQTPN